MSPSSAADMGSRDLQPTVDSPVLWVRRRRSGGMAAWRRRRRKDLTLLGGGRLSWGLEA
ncbi:hypothetical protein LINPERHAP1_LOCUS38394 [Linum perenne]